MSMQDAKDSAQKEMDEIVGNAANHNKVKKRTTGGGVSIGGSLTGDSGNQPKPELGDNIDKLPISGLVA